MNRLAKEKSPYLRHAAGQKIDWYPWSQEPFQKAKELDRPVFLSSGAVWCHWCHVMARESFEDEEVVQLLNENFVSIKLDRDERPDLDRRYQNAVAAMGSGGGWPLSIFLTPQGEPFYGGTYFPPEDRFGRPGFKKVLKSVSQFYHSNKEKVVEYSRKVINVLTPESSTPGDINESLIDEAIKRILSRFDPQNGGFGTAPKFPMPGVVELLTNRYFFSRDNTIGIAVRKTLEAMAKGGLHDHLGGGFHRYSTDEAWIIPHFEKMAIDNAGLLKNYLDAYSVFGEELFKDTAYGIIKFMDTVLTDRDGGFYASQNADVTPEDEGGYFTWTEEEMKAVLNDIEFKVLSMHLLDRKGAMHHDSRKMVLFVSAEPEEIAHKTGMDIREVASILKEGKQKLLNRRKDKREPFIDRTLYTSINGILVSSYLMAYRVFRDVKLKDFALKSVEKILGLYFVEGRLFHTHGVRGMLDDYIHFIEALINAYEVTGNKGYIDRAVELMHLCIDNFWDNDSGGFFDTDEEILGLRLKAIEDIPHPSANAVGINSLLRLYYITGNGRFFEHAEKMLRLFSNTASEFDIHSASYFLALDAYFNMLKLTLEVKNGSPLSDTAIFTFRPYKTIVYEKEDNNMVIPCIRDICYKPIRENDDLRKFIEGGTDIRKRFNKNIP